MIRISNLTKEFSGQKVLDGLNLDIEKGEVVAPCRCFWCWEINLLRSMNYLEQPDSGSIEIDDFKVNFDTM